MAAARSGNAAPLTPALTAAAGMRAGQGFTHLAWPGTLQDTASGNQGAGQAAPDHQVKFAGVLPPGPGQDTGQSPGPALRHRSTARLSRRPGPRMPRSWPRPARAAEWVDVRPTPPTSAPPPGKSQPSEPLCPRQPTTSRRFLAPDHRPPLAGVKLVRPRPRPDGRYRCGRSSLTHGPRGGAKPAAARKASTTVPTQPDDPTASHRARSPCSLDRRFPHGWVGG
jgi:hypothetical protein